MKRLALAFAACCFVSLAACSHGATRPAARSDSDGDKTPATGIRVETAYVVRGSLPQFVTAYGSVAGGANSEAALGFVESGRIASIGVSVGDRVRAGDVLARLDTRPFGADLASARASVLQARAGLTKARLGVRPQQIVQTSAQLRQASIQTSLAQAQVDRQMKLLALGVGTQSDVDTARAALATARSDRDVLEAQRSTQAHPWQPDVDAASATVAQAQSALLGANQKLELATIVAPFSGVIVARSHSEGESVDATAPVLELASDAAPVFTARFAPNDAALVSVGDPATVRPEGISRETKGRIVAIDSSQGSDHTIAVLVRLNRDEGAEPFYGPGAFGRASIRVGTTRGLVVPSASIVRDAATDAVLVFRREGARYEPVPVRVEARFRERAIVAGGDLHPGDRIATEGAYELLAPVQTKKSDND